jgi:carboxymethylenebutenolidase
VSITRILALTGALFIVTGSARAQQRAPDTVTVRSGALALRGLLWRPAGSGPFAAVLFNHGSSSSADPVSNEEPAVLGPLFAQHGYAFLFLFRQGTGLSKGQGTADGDLMGRAFATGGVEKRNRVQLELLEGEELDEARAGFAFLRMRRDVDPGRIALVGHSFGGALSLLLAARDTAVRAAVVFGAAAASWEQSPALRARLVDAVSRIAAPVLFVHAANDYSVAPGESLATAMQRHGKLSGLKIYPGFGRDVRDGHNLVFRSVPTWESDVFSFLEAHVRR